MYVCMYRTGTGVRLGLLRDVLSCVVARQFASNAIPSLRTAANTPSNFSQFHFKQKAAHHPHDELEKH
jgi:hypothetical protein